MKKNLKWILPSLGILFCLLILSVGVWGLFRTSQFGNNCYISGYNFLDANSKKNYVVEEVASDMLDRGEENTGEYAGYILVTCERTHRTDNSAEWALGLQIFLMCLIILTIVSLALETLSLFSYYRARVHLATFIVRCIILFFSLVVMVAVPCYLLALPYGIRQVFGAGFSVILLPIIALLNVLSSIIIWNIRKSMLKKSMATLGADNGEEFDDE